MWSAMRGSARGQSLDEDAGLAQRQEIRRYKIFPRLFRGCWTNTPRSRHTVPLVPEQSHTAKWLEIALAGFFGASATCRSASVIRSAVTLSTFRLACDQRTVMLKPSCSNNLVRFGPLGLCRLNTNAEFFEEDLGPDPQRRRSGLFGEA